MIDFPNDSKKSNFEIISNDEAKDNYCLIVFSSNGLKDADSFEFMQICNSKKISLFFKRIIFVRDVKCQFYINGINDDVNSISKMLSFFGKLAKGFRVFTCGYSSGGYMATLFGIYLKNVERVYSIGGILNVLDWHGSFNNYNFSDLDVVKNASEEQKQYFDLRPLINNLNAHSFFIYAGKAEVDKPMIKFIRKVENKKTYLLIFNTCKHGDYNWSYDFQYLFTESSEKLCKIFGQFENRDACSKKEFSLVLQGRINYYLNRLKRVFRALKRKIFKNNNSL